MGRPPVAELKGAHAQLFSIIDDHSRLICHGGLPPDTSEYSFQSCLRTAIARRGVPSRLYVDYADLFVMPTEQRNMLVTGVSGTMRSA